MINLLWAVLGTAGFILLCSLLGGPLDRIEQSTRDGKEYFTGGLWDAIDEGMPCATPKIYHADGTWEWAE